MSWHGYHGVLFDHSLVLPRMIGFAQQTSWVAVDAAQVLACPILEQPVFALRFDFSHGEPVRPEQMARVETIVNAQIERDRPVTWSEMTLAGARDTGALGVFEERYGDQVKVYRIGDASTEICGGPHVARTGELGHFRILKEESAGAGVRAMLE